MQSTSEPIVSVRDIHKSFGAVEVLKGVSFDVAKGEVVCIIGPSGSGKSTVLRCINGLIPIDSGSIRVANFQVEKLRTDDEIIALRKEVSIVFQQYNLYPHKTALANIMLAPVHVLREDPREVEERAVKLLAKALRPGAVVFMRQLGASRSIRPFFDRDFWFDSTAGRRFAERDRSILHSRFEVAVRR